jgi:hypothetical protein
MIATYDPNRVALIIRAVPIIGYADGSTITVTADSDSYTTQYGTAGLYVRSKQLQRGGVLTFSLLPNSPSNIFLSKLLIEDETLNTGISPILIKDGSNAGTLASGVGWVNRKPDLALAMGGDTPMRDWTIQLGTYTQFLSGIGV